MNGTTMERWKKVPSIILAFSKIGPMTFGGGFAMIPLIEKEVVERRRWLKTDEVADIFAISQSVPGAIGINSATFIGYRLAGIPGAIAAMFGILLPTFLIVMLLAIAFLRYRELPMIDSVFQGIRPAIVAIICYAGYKVSKTAVLDKTTLGILIATVALLFLANIHPALIVVGGFFLGMAAVAARGWLGLKTNLGEPVIPSIEEEEWGNFEMGDGI